MDTEQIGLDRLLAFYATERQKAQDSGLWYEVRYYYVRTPPEAIGTPDHWSPIAYCGSRNDAGIVAESLWRARGWFCEVWTCSPIRDPDIPPHSPDPIAWHLCDYVPGYWTDEHRNPNRPRSGNPGEPKEGG